MLLGTSAMRVLIIGGTGFIGRYVVRQFVAAGHRVTVYHRGETEPELPASVVHVHDRGATRPIRVFPPALVDASPEVVVHMVAMDENEARSAVQAFRGHARRIVAISSGDVYRAYGQFIGFESGPADPDLLNESSPLRTVLYPYRKRASSPDDLLYWYEKILVEREVLSSEAIEGVVLRLPKVYGPGQNADLATVYGARDHPQWRWTHGYVENAAAAIVLAAVHPAAAGRVYNVGESYTPTVEERLEDLPAMPPDVPRIEGHFQYDIAYDTRRIRQELSYREIVSYAEGLRRTTSVGG